MNHWVFFLPDSLQLVLSSCYVSLQISYRVHSYLPIISRAPQALVAIQYSVLFVLIHDVTPRGFCVGGLNYVVRDSNMAVKVLFMCQGTLLFGSLAQTFEADEGSVDQSQKTDTKSTREYLLLNNPRLCHLAFERLAPLAPFVSRLQNVVNISRTHGQSFRPGRDADVNE